MFYELKKFSRAVILACVAIGAGSSIAQAEGVNWGSPTNMIEAYESKPLFSDAEHVSYSASTENWQDAFTNNIAPSEEPLLGSKNIVLADLKPHLGQMNSVYHNILDDRGTLIEDAVRYPTAVISSGNRVDYMLVELKPHLQASGRIAAIVGQPENQIMHLADLKPHLATTVLAA